MKILLELLQTSCYHGPSRYSFRGWWKILGWHGEHILLNTQHLSNSIQLLKHTCNTEGQCQNINFNSIDISTITYINSETILIASKEKTWKFWKQICWCVLIISNHIPVTKFSKFLDFFSFKILLYLLLMVVLSSSVNMD